jgi:uncharacterized lipoprotein
MLKRSRLLIAPVLMMALAGCSGNYKYDDDDYRQLGELAQTTPEKPPGCLRALSRHPTCSA